ncbi:leucine rich repeat LRR-containing protein [Nitzschia inconspicua]|uniref:Leucine rich repeat LRR-containing protein n=1 Tax=Nitzschia inconspicua TaxID=303405 RepID=A0A9K3L1M1_9STRA|nr:leucine rich repeat LRR-containing protein [Nitzschia inconspicua]
MTTSSQGRMISDSGGRGDETHSTGSAVDRRELSRTTAADEDGNDHADTDIGMDLSSAEDDDDDASTLEKKSNPYHLEHSSKQNLGTNPVIRQSPATVPQQEHVTDDSEASADFTKKRRRRLSESTHNSPSPSHSSAPPPAPLYQPPSLQNDDRHTILNHESSNEAKHNDEPVAVSSESSGASAQPAQPTVTAHPPTKEDQGASQEQLDVSSIATTTSPQHQQLRDINPVDISYRWTSASLKLRETLLSRLSISAPTGRIQVIDFSQRGLTESDAECISNALRYNISLAVLKLGYNDLGDKGTSIIASSCSKDGRHHPHLTVLDLAFNGIGDEGCTALSLHMVAGNHTLRNLSLAGNNIRRRGATALAGAIVHGCSLSRLNLSFNRLRTEGTRVLAQAIAESENRVQQLLLRQGGIKLGYNIKPVTMEELHLDDINTKSNGLATLCSMLITSFNLHTISLANNSADDQDMSLLSQALAQNKNLPLKSLVLSFNNITCVGVECLMNAVWGSTTLREVKLDNNKIQDRGAQLCAVVLGSIRLEVLDVSFNKVSTVGIKALMKSLSENDSLQQLSLCGIPMDQNASKAVSYALAYNQSLEKFNIDSCSVGYSGQRHIVAGIVSNRNVKLRILTGFPLGPITMTLGIPQLPDEWGNDRVLSFIRFMWAYWTATLNGETAISSARGPAAPSMVAAAAKKAFGSLSHDDEAKLLYQTEHHAKVVDDNPMVAPETSILVRSLSGRNLQIPSWKVQLEASPPEPKHEYGQESWESDTDSYDRSSYTASSESLHTVHVTAASVDNIRRNRNLGWLRSHMQSLVEVGNLAFNNADLWQLHQYFFSPAYTAEDDLDNDDDKATSYASTPDNPPTPAPSEVGKSGIGRAISFQTLKKAVSAAAQEQGQRPNKRGSLDEELKDHGAPIAKRPKQLKQRIAYYPRVRNKLESLGTKPSAQTLCLLRQLKYVESVMLRGKNVYSRQHPEEHPQEEDFPNTADVEMVLLDLL